MPRFPVTPAKQADLEHRMQAVGLCEHDLDERFFQSAARPKAGRCGVHLRHRTLPLEVKCQKAASQGLNRFHARRQLVEELEARSRGTTRAAEKLEARRLAKARKKRSPTPRSAKTAAPTPVAELSAMFLLPRIKHPNEATTTR